MHWAEMRPPKEQIAKLAYRMWESCGRPEGHDISVAIWLIAEDFAFLHAYLINKQSRRRDLEA